jgi:hypothetical protein
MRSRREMDDGVDICDMRIPARVVTNVADYRGTTTCGQRRGVPAYRCANVMAVFQQFPGHRAPDKSGCARY